MTLIEAILSPQLQYAELARQERWRQVNIPIAVPGKAAACRELLMVTLQLNLESKEILQLDGLSTQAHTGRQ